MTHTQTADLFAADAIPKSAIQVSRHVDKALKQIDAERALKYASYRQIERVERLKKLEEKLRTKATRCGSFIPVCRSPCWLASRLADQCRGF